MLGGHELAVLIEVVLQGKIRFGVVLESVGIVLGAHVVILPERIAFEVRPEVKAAHVLIAKELYSIKVVNLALQNLSALPKVAHRGNVGVVPVAVHGLYANALVCLGVFKNVNSPKALFAEILTYDSNEEVKMLLIPEFRHLCGEILQFEYFVL